MKNISTCLWFDTQAEDAAQFYVSIFKNSRVTGISRYGDAGPGPKGQVMTVAFTIDGRDFLALNGGPHFKFTPAVSLIVNCDTQSEIDDYWAKLGKEGSPQQCGWLTDKFGLSWQIVPTALADMMTDPDAEKSNRVMGTIMEMVKLDIAELERAFEGHSAETHVDS